MVVGVVGVVATVASAGALGPVVIPLFSSGTTVIVGGAAGTGAAAAAAAAAAGTGAAVAAGTSAAAVAAGTSAAAVAAGTGAAAGAVGAGAATTALGTAAGILSGPVGWAVLGATEEPTSALYTFDCWKLVLHDQSSDTSNGKFLREVAADPRVREVKMTLNNTNADLPHLVLKNIWDEEFRIDYVYLPSIGLAAHAVRI